MHEGWKLKKALSSDVSNSMVDEAYHHAIKHGALAGKILGAGGGGFLLLVVPPERQQAVKTSLSKLVHVPFKFEYDGSKIALYQPKGL